MSREINAAARGGARSGSRDDARANGLWEHLVADLDSVPERERERLRRVGALRGHSVDDTHPPTHLRQQCLLVGEPVPATVTCDEETTRAIAAELAEARRKVARQVLRDGVARSARQWIDDCPGAITPVRRLPEPTVRRNRLRSGPVELGGAGSTADSTGPPLCSPTPRCVR
ncbi:hypothetical protein SAMN05216532_0692 [Streptomyces sp. 2231.1]|uniref:hypothetical protein n=1 Tax=Streptomyces sp. 2231.1 TaxID=1855347 RepID=UPI000899D011|nr:hypothetical protein [Streptomyces sp. 2231.1]SEC17706.1 hypothetical protein SAMN05216532_0692 [Streptomyces sp. 2231.1]